MQKKIESNICACKTNVYLAVLYGAVASAKWHWTLRVPSRIRKAFE